jgi:hypothetical protein
MEVRTMQIRKKLLVGAIAAATIAGGANIAALANSSGSTGQVSRDTQRQVSRQAEPGDDRGREAETRGREAEGELEFEFEAEHEDRGGRDDNSGPSDSSGPSDNSGFSEDHSGSGHGGDDN